MSRSDRTLTSSGSLPVLAEAVARRVALRVKGVDLPLQVLQVVEALIHAGEADVRDLVELPQLLLGKTAHVSRRHFRHALRPQLGLDLIRRLLGGIGAHGPPRQRLAEARGELLPVELLASTIALDDDETGRLDPLV